MVLVAAGLVLLACTWLVPAWRKQNAQWLRWVAWGLLSGCVLMQAHSAPLFFGAFAVILLLIHVLPEAANWFRSMQQRSKDKDATQVEPPVAGGGESSVETTSIIMFLANCVGLGSALLCTSGWC